MMQGFEHKLNTNYIPTQVEITDIKSVVKYSQEQLCKISLQIARLQSRSSQLSLEREHLRRGINSYRSMLAPVRRLVPEILQEIFYHCLPISHNAIMRSNEAPLFLGRVCSQWRQVTYSTPRLWTSIHIVVPSFEPYVTSMPTDDSQLLSAVSSWLSRSGALPLSISFRSFIYSPDPSFPTNPHVRPFFDLLTPFAPRWKTVSFMIDHYDWTEFFDRYSISDTPLLEDIHIDGIQHVPFVDNGSPPGLAPAVRENSILCAPRVRSIALPLFAGGLVRLPIKWSELLELDLSTGRLSLQVALRTLGLCPNLLNCAICVPDWDINTTELYSPPTLVLPKLEAMTLVGDTNMPLVFKSLVAPELRHLALRPSQVVAYNYSLLEQLDIFLQGLVRPLQELYLGGKSIEETSLVKILEMVPGLARLSIANPGIDEALTEDWAPTPWSDKFRFTDGILKRFIPNPGVQLTNQPLSTDHDTSTGGSWPEGGDQTLGEICDELPACSPRPENKFAPGCLVPNLKILHCTRATFPESSFLEFLRTRSLGHNKLGVAHLRAVSVSYVPYRKRYEDFANQVQELGRTTGMSVHLIYPGRSTVEHLQSNAHLFGGSDPMGGFGYPPAHHEFFW